MGKWLAVALCLLFISGCGQSEQVESMQSGRVVVPYPELDSFDNEQVLGMGYAAEGAQPNWAEVRRIASTEDFKESLARLEASKVPDGVPTEKKSHKDAVVAAGKKLGEVESDEETQAAYKELMDSLRAFRT